MELDSEIWFKPYLQKKRVSAFIIDETIIHVGDESFWLGFVSNQLTNHAWNLRFEERNMFVATNFIHS